MSNFKLVNPIIIGGFKSNIISNNVEDAAKSLWNDLSKHIVGNVPRLGFTLRDSNDKLYNFIVKEKIKQGGGKGSKNAVSYSIKLKNNLTNTQEKNYLKQYSIVLNKINNIGQSGGKDKKNKKKHKKKNDEDNSDSSSSSSSSSSNSNDELYDKMKYFKERKNEPITYWWYTPLLYKTENPCCSLYIPTFVAPIAPYIEIDVSSAFF